MGGGQVLRSRNLVFLVVPGQYWSMYKLPMFGCHDPSEVVREIDACAREFPNAKVRVIAFDSTRQVQVAGFIVRK